MKSIRKILLLIPFCFLLLGCGKQTSKVTTVTDGGVKEFDIYSFDENAQTNFFREFYYDDNKYYDVEISKVHVKIEDTKVTSILYHYKGQWICYEKLIKEYDKYGDVTSIELYDYSLRNNDWQGVKKEVYTYNDNGDLIRTMTYTWSETKETWVGNNGVKHAQILLDVSKNLLLEASAGTTSLIGTDENKYVIRESSTSYSVTKEALKYMNEIETLEGISGNFKVIYDYNYGNSFVVEIYDLVIDGQRIYWNSSNNSFYTR